MRSGRIYHPSYCITIRVRTTALSFPYGIMTASVRMICLVLSFWTSRLRSSTLVVASIRSSGSRKANLPLKNWASCCYSWTDRRHSVRRLQDLQLQPTPTTSTQPYGWRRYEVSGCCLRMANLSMLLSP
eukprot:PhF_6_TR1969/c0_g1_i1/m.3254